MFENRVQIRLFDSKKDEILGGWKILHSEELQN
jgi:hypothetical protein